MAKKHARTLSVQKNNNLELFLELEFSVTTAQIEHSDFKPRFHCKNRESTYNARTSSVKKESYSTLKKIWNTFAPSLKKLTNPDKSKHRSKRSISDSISNVSEKIVCTEDDFHYELVRNNTRPLDCTSDMEKELKNSGFDGVHRKRRQVQCAKTE